MVYSQEWVKTFTNQVHQTRFLNNIRTSYILLLLHLIHLKNLFISPFLYKMFSFSSDDKLFNFVCLYDMFSWCMSCFLMTCALHLKSWKYNNSDMNVSYFVFLSWNMVFVTFSKLSLRRVLKLKTFEGFISREKSINKIIMKKLQYGGN